MGNNIASHIVVLILGAVVLIGCQKQGDDSNWERPRMAGEELNAVKTASGKVANMKCVQELLKQEAAGGPDVDVALVEEECGVTINEDSNMAASKVSKSTAMRSRMFYGDNSVYGYYYLPYYINYNYTTTNTSNTSNNDLCKTLFGVSCKKANKWWNNYFGYDYSNTNNYNTWGSSYQPGCYSYVSYMQSYGGGFGGNSAYSYLYTSPQYNNNNSWNSSWYGCYNYYY